MQNKYLNLIILAAAIIFTASFPAAAQKCGKQADDTEVKLHIYNATDKPFTVNYVDQNCKESSSDEKIEPGRGFTGDTTNGHAFRVREAGSNRLLQEVVADPNKDSITIGVVKNSDPRQSFIQTLNQIRRGRGLAPMEFDDSLTRGCQWFAELMAKHDQGGHDAVEIGGSTYADMQHPWLRSTKMGYKGDGGTEATAGPGEWKDISVLGGEAMIGWSASSTHFRPFLSLDGQVFKQVGFGYAKSTKHPSQYYVCAVFGNQDGNGGGDDAGQQGNSDTGGKEPVKTEVPAGLKFTAAKFFQMLNGAEKYSAAFTRSSLEELSAEFSFDNPSGKPFNVQTKTYFNGKVISSEPMNDLKDSGAMSISVAGKEGEPGRAQAGTYRFEVLLNGEIVLSAEATVK